jgi:hypothetical protein
MTEKVMLREGVRATGPGTGFQPVGPPSPTISPFAHCFLRRMYVPY